MSANLPKQRNLWFEKMMAIIATVNLGLVLFDLSYIPWRNFYLRRLPQITHLYDSVKGIEPHRETDNYLVTVNTLKHQVSQTGLRSPQVETQLAELRRLSSDLIETNPFAAVGKSGTLEKIKNRMRDHIHQESAKRSFATFWSQAYLSQKGWYKEINFFDKDIAPLIATNYYRHIGENGEFIDNFWIIDLPFVILFSLDLLARSFYIKRRHPGFSWLNIILWRWYDLLLLIPFCRWLRIIPVVIRLDQAQLIDLKSVRQQANLGIVTNFAGELTEVVVVRVINQLQSSIQRGELTHWLSQKPKQQSYIDINNLNELEAIAGILVQTIIYQVLPKVEPEITAIIHHTIDSALNQSPIYRSLQGLPMVGDMQTELSKQLTNQIVTNLYNALVKTSQDPVLAKLSSEFMTSFSAALGSQIKNTNILPEIQSLLLDFLEEVKLNYVQNLSTEERSQILEQIRKPRTQVTVEPVVSSKSSSVISLREKR